MKLTVTEKGLLIPKELLGESQDFEIIQEMEKLLLLASNKHLLFGI